jgi:hypothetical protein
MRVGFTGTRHGITPDQYAALRDWLDEHEVTAAHHGCAVGADEAFAVLASRAAIHVVGHPPDNDRLVSERALLCNDECRDPEPYLVRNRAIIDACDVLLACPRGTAEEQRSGTWSTIRYARRCRRRLVIIWPNGTVETEVQGA